MCHKRGVCCTQGFCLLNIVEYTSRYGGFLSFGMLMSQFTYIMSAICAESGDATMNLGFVTPDPDFSIKFADDSARHHSAVCMNLPVDLGRETAPVDSVLCYCRHSCVLMRFTCYTARGCGRRCRGHCGAG